MKSCMAVKDMTEFIEAEFEFMFKSLSDDMKWHNENDPRLSKLQPAEILLTNVWRQFVERELTE